ncbi:uncharacterized protein HaLaN_27902, partial [Haematococcus lacustris]
MTTAHRPTWAPAKGGEEQGGARYYVPSVMMSAKNLPGHTHLKFRQAGQASASDLEAKDLRAELESNERQHFTKKNGINFEEERQRDLALLEAPPVGSIQAKALIPKAVDADDEDEPEPSSSDSDE